MTTYYNGFTFLQIATGKLISDYEIVSEYDAKRLDVAKAILARDVKRTHNGLKGDSGIYGKVFELLMRKPSSKVTKVQIPNASDYIVQIDGRTTHIEVKTNCGRIENFLTSKNNRTKYVVYAMCMEKESNYTKKDGSKDIKRWVIEPVIMPMESFVSILVDTEAIKTIEHNDLINSDRQRAIKQWYNPFYIAMKEYNGTPFNRLGNYKSSDIK